MPESLNDALIECVKACGGSKAVGAALWGAAAGVEVVQRKLLACLNPERNEKLSLDEIVTVLRMARERGCHVGMQFLAVTLGYAEPLPIAPVDEAAELRRRVLIMGREMQEVLHRLEQVDRPTQLRSVP